MKKKWKVVLIGLACIGGVLGIFYSWPYVFIMGGEF